MMKLIDKSQRAVSQLAPFSLAELCHRLASNLYLPFAREIEPSQQVQQGTFTRTGTTHNGDTFSGTDC